METLLENRQRAALILSGKSYMDKNAINAGRLNVQVQRSTQAPMAHLWQDVDVDGCTLKKMKASTWDFALYLSESPPVE